MASKKKKKKKHYNPLTPHRPPHTVRLTQRLKTQPVNHKNQKNTMTPQTPPRYTKISYPNLKYKNKNTLTVAVPTI